MSEFLGEDVERVVELAGGDVDPLLAEMTEHGRERGFPIVGPAVGRLLRTLARLVDAERVFEFGSGFGYSAAWFAGALPADGDIVLTDYDEENLAAAREFLERAGHAGKAHFEAGDAMETFRRYDGPFDVVLVDHDKSMYADAFDLLRPELAEKAVVVADNVLGGPVTPAGVRAGLEGERVEGSTAGVVAYLEAVRDDPDFETTVVPLGEGVAVSHRR